MDFPNDKPTWTPRLKEKVINKPTAELEMVVRRAEDSEELWTYLFAKEELTAREKLKANEVGLMFYPPEKQDNSDFIVRFGK